MVDSTKDFLEHFSEVKDNLDSLKKSLNDMIAKKQNGETDIKDFDISNR